MESRDVANLANSEMISPFLNTPEVVEADLVRIEGNDEWMCESCAEVAEAT